VLKSSGVGDSPSGFTPQTLPADADAAVSACRGRFLRPTPLMIGAAVLVCRIQGDTPTLLVKVVERRDQLGLAQRIS
jgi:hypothetical protein